MYPEQGWASGVLYGVLYRIQRIVYRIVSHQHRRLPRHNRRHAPLVADSSLSEASVWSPSFNWAFVLATDVTCGIVFFLCVFFSI